jgi:hypothetical protein
MRCPICGKIQAICAKPQTYTDGRIVVHYTLYLSSSTEPPCLGHPERTREAIPQVFQDAFTEGDLQV